MRRHVVTLFALASLFAMAITLVLPGAGLAQADESLAGHPLVGTWLFSDPSQPENVFFIAFTSDGTLIQVEPSAGTGLGVWEATGPTTANLYMQGVSTEEWFEGTTTIRASIEVSADGTSLTAEYTVQFISSDGEDTGELGPGSITGTRVVVEPMGTPTGPLFEEATPAS
jgi:hypothetical protein